MIKVIRKSPRLFQLVAALLTAAAISSLEANPKLVQKHRAAAEAAWKKNDLQRAAAEWRQAVQAAFEAGPGNVSTLAALYEASWFFYRLGELRETEEILANALQRLDEPAAEHGRLYKGLFRLRMGNVYLDTGRLNEAEQEFTEAYELFHRTLSVAHPFAVEARTGVGRVLTARKEYPQAETILKESLQWITHPFVAANPTRSPFSHYTRQYKYEVRALVLRSLGELYEGQEKLSQAADYYRDYLKAMQQEYGKRSGELVPALIALARVSLAESKSEQAEEHLKRALEVTEKAPGEVQRHAWAAAELAALYYRNQRRDQMEAVTAGILKHDQQLREAPAFSKYALRMAGHLSKANWNDANEFLRQAIEAHEKQFGPGNTGLIPILQYAADLAHQQEQTADSMHYRKELIAALEKRDGPEALTLIQPHTELGRLYASQKNYGEAEKSLQRQLAIMEKHFGPEDTRLANALDDLAAFYTEHGKTSEAAEAGKRANDIRIQAVLKR